MCSTCAGHCRIRRLCRCRVVDLSEKAVERANRHGLALQLPAELFALPFRQAKVVARFFHTVVARRARSIVSSKNATPRNLCYNC